VEDLAGVRNKCKTSTTDKQALTAIIYTQYTGTELNLPRTSLWLKHYNLSLIAGPETSRKDSWTS
jgi:hypothetical protein